MSYIAYFAPGGVIGGCVIAGNRQDLRWAGATCAGALLRAGPQTRLALRNEAATALNEPKDPPLHPRARGERERERERSEEHTLNPSHW